MRRTRRPRSGSALAVCRSRSLTRHTPTATGEIFVMNADGSSPVNITQSPKTHEHYPKRRRTEPESAFPSMKGRPRHDSKSLVDGCGRPESEEIGGERARTFLASGRQGHRLSSPGVSQVQRRRLLHERDELYDLGTGKIEAHPNSANLHHLYNPCFAPNGKWVVATVHAGMGSATE